MDKIEIPVYKYLYRQSSLETRLYPTDLPDEEIENTLEETKPKIVDELLKELKEIDLKSENKIRKRNLVEDLKKNTQGENAELNNVECEMDKSTIRSKSENVECLKECKS